MEAMDSTDAMISIETTDSTNQMESQDSIEGLIGQIHRVARKVLETGTQFRIDFMTFATDDAILLSEFPALAIEIRDSRGMPTKNTHINIYIYIQIYIYIYAIYNNILYFL